MTGIATSLREQDLAEGLNRLRTANQQVAYRTVGDAPERQPVHTVYGGAHLFKADTCVKLGALARRAFATYGADPAGFARALGMVSTSPAKADWLAAAVHDRVGRKLAAEPVEDFRLDFEDGYGIRPDAEEDATAVAAAAEVARAMKDGTLPPFIGIRVKTLSEELKRRAVRTTDIFLTALLGATGGRLPPNFVVTLPKVTVPAHVAVFADMLAALELRLGLAPMSLRMEIMIETTLALMDEQGASPLLAMARAGGGRVIGAHFGTYDYTASCSITAAHQAMDHTACDFARHMMKVAYAGQPIRLSDGATNVMPVGPHRAEEGGAPLTPAQAAENAAVVHRAWRLAYGHVRNSLVNAFYQGWDLHPAQLPVRYAAVYAYFLDGLEPATNRLRTFVERAAQATLLGDVFDDAATGQGLLNYFLRALSCGAITEAEALATGLSLEEFRGRSFLKILDGRRARGHG